MGFFGAFNTFRTLWQGMLGNIKRRDEISGAKAEDPASRPFIFSVVKEHHPELKDHIYG